MGACCSSSKVTAVPEKRNEMVKSDKTAEKPVVESPPVTHNVLVVNDKTSPVVVVAESASKVKEAVTPTKEEPSAVKLTPSLPPLSPNKSKSDQSITSETTTEQSEPSPSTSTRNSEIFLNRSSSSRPRVLSGDISSRSSFTSTKKDNREFRFFLPLIDEADEAWIEPDLAAAYRSAVEALQKTIRDGEDSINGANEWKDDTFIVGRPYFSLRFLEDKKLEMRVKTENTPIWMEKWSKVRFGKKAVSHYKADIVSYLNDVGHKDPLIERIINEPQLLTVQRREINTLPELGVELSLLSVPEQKESQQQQVRQRQWLSFCMAADSNKIQEFIHSHNAGDTLLWLAVQLGSAIYDSNNEAAVSHSFIPVMSGYAQWVRLVFNKFSTSEAWKDEMIPCLDSFLLFLKGDSP